jgi:peptidoglycan/xylan/chitin deacetylase (PgdA/CDA1 family)
MRDLDQPLPYVYMLRYRRRAQHVTLLITVFTFILGSLTLAFANAPTASMPDVHGMNDGTLSGAMSSQHHEATPISVPHLTSTSGILHTAMPRLSPIAPFPSYLPQQVAVLEAHDRFFYHGNTNLPEVALTFDDGPNPPYTSRVLTILQRYRITATFFDVGSRVQAYPELVRQEYVNGHSVGNHTWGHANLSQLSEPSIIWQLTTDEDIIKHIIGVRPTFFRPPYGAFNALTLKNINDFGLISVLWNVDPIDWSRPGVNTIVERVLNQTRDGSMILLHDGGGDRSQTVAALPIIIKSLQQRGFRFVSLQQLIADMHQSVPRKSPVTATPSSQQERWRRELQE